MPCHTDAPQGGWAGAGAPALLLAMLLTAPALAGDAPPHKAPPPGAPPKEAQPPWTLQDCIRVAHEKSPLVKAALLGVEAMEHQYREAWWAWFPELSVRSLATAVPPQPSAGLDYWAFYSRTDIDVWMPLYTFGKISSARKMARAGADIAGEMVRVAKGELSFQVTRAWYGLMLAAELDELIADGEDKLEKARDKLRKLEEEDSPEFDQADVFELRVYEARVERLVLENEKLARLSETGLRVAMGLPEGAPLRLPEKRTLVPSETRVGDLSAYLDLAKTHRPELAQARHRIEVAEGNLGRRWAELFPDFFVAGSFSVAKTTPVPDEDEVKGTPFENVTFDAIGGGAAIGLRLTLDYPQKIARYNKATAELEVARLALDGEHAKLRVELEGFWREALNAQRLLGSSERAMKASRSLLTLRAHEYENGVDDSVSLEDVLGAAVDYLGQKAEWLRSIHTFNTSLARLSQVVGADLTKLPEARPAAEKQEAPGPEKREERETED